MSHDTVWCPVLDGVQALTIQLLLLEENFHRLLVISIFEYCT